MPKKKGMNRTAGTARRKMSASERVSYGLKTGAPLTGSASGVKSISLREAGEVLTQGIVSARGKKLSFDPAGLAMALPVGKVAKAAKALRAAGNAGNRLKFAAAEALEARLAAKTIGRNIPKDYSYFPKGLASGPGTVEGKLRSASTSVFPRAAGAVGESSQEITARLGRQSNLPMELKRQTSQAVKQTSTGFTKFSKRVAGPQPAAGSVDMVKKTAKQFGQKVSGKEAKNISRLLRGRDR